MERNQELVKKRKQGWPYRKLARFFGIEVSTVHEIYHRDKDKYAKRSNGGALGVMHRRRVASVRS